MKKIFFWVVLAGFIVLIPFFTCEIILRAVFYKKISSDREYYWSKYGFLKNEPSTNEFDAQLGWKPKPGSYVYSAYVPGEKDISLTIESDGSRKTGPAANINRPVVFGIGCSFMEGWAINDEETMTWKLQQQLPELKFVNLGVVGYSGYQSFLRLKQYVAEKHIKPAAVLYTFLDCHETRNVGDLTHIHDLFKARQRIPAHLPHCLLDKHGDLKHFPPETLAQWPGDRVFFTVHLLKRAYIKIVSGNRRKHQKEITEKLFLEMKSWCEKQNIALRVVILIAQESNLKHYQKFFRDHEIKNVNCSGGRFSGPGLSVSGDGHPNGELNTLWTECVLKEWGEDFKRMTVSQQ